MLKCSEFLNNLISEKISDYHEDVDDNNFTDYVCTSDYNTNSSTETDSNIIEGYLKELMNNACFFNETSVPPLAATKNTRILHQHVSEEDDIYDDQNSLFAMQSRRLVEKRRNSITIDHQQQKQRSNSITTTNKSRYKSFSFSHLSSLVQDLFIAGTETLSSSLTWAMIYAANFQSCQELMWQEIDQVLGREKAPTSSDRHKMPYMEAFINETMRFHCAGPILISRCTICDVTLCGYRLPADTFIMVNMWSCMRDPEYWTEPDEFEPRRFLDPTGALQPLKKFPAMMPFGAGKRACVGESIARLQLFLILTSIMQKFSVTFENEKDLNNQSLLNGIPGIGLSATNVNLKFKLR